MWPVIINMARTNAPWIVFPFALTIGAIGYTIESKFSDKQTPWRESTISRREQRILQEIEDGSTSAADLKHPDFVPKTIFERNVSPGLRK